MDRTHPPDFLFNVKAYGLLTGHHLDVARLPEALKAMLPKSERPRHTGRVANEALGPDARTWALRELRKALRPLQEANKLGYVLFQLAPWMKFSDETLQDLAGYPARDRGLAYVSIDGPRSGATVPSLPASTAATSVFRLHGRNVQGFLKQVQGKSPSVADKYGYLYEMRELEEIARAAGALDGRAERVHLAMNNNRGDWPAINGLQLKEMLLEDWHPPDRAVLIEALEERHAKKRKGRRGGP